jgi:hypothetical protein
MAWRFLITEIIWAAGTHTTSRLCQAGKKVDEGSEYL